MQLAIKSDDDSFTLLLEANQYREIWRAHSRAILASFRKVTGLTFQQRLITARVYDGQIASAGWNHYPMKLPGRHDIPETKLEIMTHELAHRLLSGNYLTLAGLRVTESSEDDDAAIVEAQHRLIYLFLYDVFYDALGQAGALRCEKDEKLADNPPYTRAWEWAMNMTFEQRQQVLATMTAKKLTRAEWDKFDDTKPADTKAAHWLKQLDDLTKTIALR